MKILVTGQEGQVARALAEILVSDGDTVEFLARPECDLADQNSIKRALARRDFDVLVNAAAYTDVEQAEDEPELAQRVNAVAPGVMAEIAAEKNAALIHLSTDYVFDGSGSAPWKEDDATGPLCVYGKTKLEGEEAVRAAAPDNHLILRTAWVYSPFGRNFVKTMLRLAEKNDHVSVVNDQFGNPTSAIDIAKAIAKIIVTWQDEPATGDRKGLGSTFHLAGSGDANWFDFATRVFQESQVLGGPIAEVRGIPATDFPTKAVRPANSRLDCSRFRIVFGYQSPDWRQSVGETVRRLLD